MPDSKIANPHLHLRTWGALGWRVSSHLLGVGAVLLALEAPSLGQLAQAPLPGGPGEVMTDPGAAARLGDRPGAISQDDAATPDAADVATEAQVPPPEQHSPETPPAPPTQRVEPSPEPVEGSREARAEAISEDPEGPNPEEAQAAIAEAEPIPTLADRCAAPEATLFPAAPAPDEELLDEAPAEPAAPRELAEAELAEAEAAVLSGEGQAENRAETAKNTAGGAIAADEAIPEPDITAIEQATAEGTVDETVDEAAAEPGATDDAAAPDAVPIVAPDTPFEALDREAEAQAAAKAAAEKQRVCQLFSADQQYRAGDIEGARRQYQAAKPDFDLAMTRALALPQRPAALSDPAQLSPGGQVFWREAAAGRAKNLETGMLIPLELLVQRHPEYIPGQVQLAETLVTLGRAEEGLAVLAAATRDYPREPALVKAHIALAAQQKQWMDAAMLARQFAQLNPDHPEAPEFDILAEEHMANFQDEVRDRLRANTIANVLTGAVSVALTGSIWNSLSAIQTTATMLRGEAGVGNGISQSIKRQVELVEDEEIVTYVNEMGQKLAALAGRDEFDYEFNVLMDPNLNAFALPGGKIFVNAGAIAQTRSEAELAGLLSHELAHAVLSHGFQLVSDGSLLADVSRFIPYGGFASNLIVLNYSRAMERQADELGTRILAASGYAADGLYGLMKTLGEATKDRQPRFAWLSTHPETDERVKNIEAQLLQEGLDPYRFEGVEQHFRMRVKVKRLIEDWQERRAKEAQERPWWR